MLVRALCRNADTSGNPENVYQNTLHIYSGDNGTLGEFADSFLNPLATFYQAVGSAYSGTLNNQLEVRFYNMADPEPRVPEIRTSTIAYGDPLKAALPEELAIVITLLPDPPITRRRRGRIYLGPLNTDCMTYSVLDTHPMVAPSIVTQFAVNAENLRDNLAAVGGIWSVYSSKYGGHTPVVGGFVDDAFDIQRRRGMDASARTFWGASGSLRMQERNSAASATYTETLTDHLCPDLAAHAAGV